jgi:hypothetical protein
MDLALSKDLVLQHGLGDTAWTWTMEMHHEHGHAPRKLELHAYSGISFPAS